MQEVTKTVLALLENNWTLTGDLNKTKIIFRRGEPDNLQTRFAERNISIEVVKSVRPIKKRVLKRSESFEMFNINLWLLVKPLSDKRINTLSDARQSMEDLIEDIILANQRSATNIKFIKPSNVIYPDNLKEEPPVLRAVMTFIAHYEKGNA